MREKIPGKRDPVENHRILIDTSEALNRKKADIIAIPVIVKTRKFKSRDLISINTRGIDLDRNELHRG